MARELEASTDAALMARLYGNMNRVPCQSPHAEGECWESTYSQNNKGYCQIRWRVNGQTILIRVHRLSWSYDRQKEIPDNMQVCHRCDNPCCVNPDHLFLGTAKDNTQDALEKGRLNPASGEDHGQSKLDWRIVFWVRKHCNQWINGKRVTQQQLADRIDERWGISISQNQVSTIINSHHLLDYPHNQWADPHWDPKWREYTRKPVKWQESWGDWKY